MQGAKLNYVALILPITELRITYLRKSAPDREKEVLKALQAQEKQATRLRQRNDNTGPKDDLDLEWETLVSQQQADG